MRKLLPITTVVGLTAAGLVLGVGPASAAPTPNCRFNTSFNNNSFSASCVSGPGTFYRVTIRCSDRPSVFLLGPEARYGPNTGSARGCPLNTGAKLVFTGLLTR